MVQSRRARGEGGLSFDARRDRWVAVVTVGYGPTGKRIVRRASGRTKTEARLRLREALRDQEDGVAIAGGSYTDADAVNDWLLFGLAGRSPATVDAQHQHAAEPAQRPEPRRQAGHGA